MKRQDETTLRSIVKKNFFPLNLKEQVFQQRRERERGRAGETMMRGKEEETGTIDATHKWAIDAERRGEEINYS